MINTTTGEVAMFPCNTWLSRYQGAKSNKVVLAAEAGKKKRDSSGSEIGIKKSFISLSVNSALKSRVFR